MDPIKAHMNSPEVRSRIQAQQVQLDKKVEEASLRLGRPLSSVEVHENQLENNRLFDLTEALDPVLRQRKEDLEDEEKDS